MDLNFTEEQVMVRKAAREFLGQNCTKEFVRRMEQDAIGHSSELWKKMAELGWLGMPFPEKYADIQYSFVDFVVLFEEMGRFLLPSPFFSTVILGGLTVLEGGSEEQRQEILPKIIDGELYLTLALTEPVARYSITSMPMFAVCKGEEYEISGTRLFVPDFHIAKSFVCIARTQEGNSLFLIDARSTGINYIPLSTLSGDKQFEVTLDKVLVPAKNLVGRPGQAWEIIKRVLQKAVTAKCAEMSGMAQEVLEMSVSYAKERKQFGRPIGSFQAIQHHCANMAIDVDTSRYLTYMAAFMIDKELPCSKQVSIAKAWASEACRRVMALGHQIHGGIAATIDHDMQLYSRRAKAAELALGDSNFHRELVAQEIGL
jgi:alkylation response protein AidB-like acyl-CoA dehydrogenase